MTTDLILVDRNFLHLAKIKKTSGIIRMKHLH